MFAEVGEQVLLGTELVRKFTGDECCFVVATNCTTRSIDLHFRVFHHVRQLCWNLIVIASMPLLGAYHSVSSVKNDRNHIFEQFQILN